MDATAAALPVPVEPISRRSVWLHRAARYLATTIAFVYMCSIGAFLAGNPNYAWWDMLPYMGVALDYQGTPSDQIRTQVMQSVKATVPPDAYASLTGQPSPSVATSDMAFRQAVAANDKDFLAQLPFYTVKPLYPALMAALNFVGVDLITSGIVLSILCFIGFGLVLYFWIARLLPPLLAVVIAALLAINPYAVMSARAIGPDMMSVALLVGAAFVMIELRRPWTVVCLLLLAILARPENVIYAGLFVLYMGGVRRDLSIFGTIAALILSGGLFFLVSQGSYGWRTLVYYTFVQRDTVPNVSLAQMTAHDFLNVYLSRIGHILTGQGDLPIFALVGFGALCLKFRTSWLRDHYLHLLILAAMLCVARMAILPQDSFRALLANYMLVTVVFIEACVQLRRLASFQSLRYAVSNDAPE